MKINSISIFFPEIGDTFLWILLRFLSTCFSKFSDTNRVTSSEFVALEEEWYNYKKWFRIFTKEVVPRVRKIENFDSKISKSRFRCYWIFVSFCLDLRIFKKKRRRRGICHFERSSRFFERIIRFESLVWKRLEEVSVINITDKSVIPSRRCTLIPLGVQDLSKRLGTNRFSAS